MSSHFRLYLRHLHPLILKIGCYSNKWKRREEEDGRREDEGEVASERWRK